MREIDAVGLLELGRNPVDDPLVEVVAAEMRVAVGRLHFDHALTHFEDGDVERAAAEVVHGDGLVFLLVEPVRQSGRCRLVDDAEHVEARNLAGVLGRLALRVVEVRGHGDDRVGHRLAEVILCGLLQLLQHHRGDFRRRVFLAAGLDPHVAVVCGNDVIRDALLFAGDFGEFPPDEPLDRKNCVFGIGDGLTLGHLPYQPLTFFSERDDRRSDPRAFLVDEHGGLAALHHRHDGVRRAEVDSNDFLSRAFLPCP